MTKKEIILERARVAGYHADKATYTRLIIEAGRVKSDEIRKAYNLGATQQERGHII